MNFAALHWGKAWPPGSKSWHPLPYHGLDVAAAGDAILAVRPRLLDSIAACAGLPVEMARSWLLFALAVHDIGKYPECFQVKSDCIEPPATLRSRLAGTPKNDPGHGQSGLAMWDKSCTFDFDPAGQAPPADFAKLFHEGHARRFRWWVEAVFGHHGKPIAGPERPDNFKFEAAGCISPQSAAAARSYVEACADLFGVARHEFSAFDEAGVKRATWLVAGFAILADWIGSCSDDQWFPYLSPDWPDTVSYWPIAQARAASAVRCAGMAAPSVAPCFELADALALRPGVAALASPLQDWATAFGPEGQALVIVEDLTGAGKTEAALIAAHRLMAAGQAGGLYWALPTMATANGLYARLANSYSRLFNDSRSASLVLAHSKSTFHDAFRRSVLPAGRDEPQTTPPTTDDDQSASARCAAWIADDRRRALLADVGIGTIDQALIGILPVKHQALRLAALSQRVLVVDEIHSYDAYTARLVETLLGFHAAMGGSAILLSATLSKTLRTRLVAAFSTGAGWTKRKPLSQAFPLVTLLTKDGLHEENPGASSSLDEPATRDKSRGTRRDLPVVRLDSESAAIELLAARHRAGQACVWVRNTVHDALAANAMLVQKLGAANVDLFHARFTLGDRLDRENEALSNFGKKDIGRRNRVLIATQVVEQSLDLDFDTMISDLAPVDMLIQRAGRLHRHDRGAREKPVLCVLSPEPTDAAKGDWYARMFPKAQYVYPDHGRLWLTMRSVKGGINLASGTPRDLIETVFDDAPNLPAPLDAVSLKAYGKVLAATGQATSTVLSLDTTFHGSYGSWKSEQLAPTRLGSLQRTLRLARWDGVVMRPWYDLGDMDQAKAWRLSEVSVLAAKIDDVVTADDRLARARDAVLAEWVDRFDPPLLVPLVESADKWTAVGRRKLGKSDEMFEIRYCRRMGLRL